MEKFLTKVKKTKDCWKWLGCAYNLYGAFYFQGKKKYAHRVSYELFHGKFPKEC